MLWYGVSFKINKQSLSSKSFPDILQNDLYEKTILENTKRTLIIAILIHYSHFLSSLGL